MSAPVRTLLALTLTIAAAGGAQSGYRAWRLRLDEEATTEGQRDLANRHERQARSAALRDSLHALEAKLRDLPSAREPAAAPPRAVSAAAVRPRPAPALASRGAGAGGPGVPAEAGAGPQAPDRPVVRTPGKRELDDDPTGGVVPDEALPGAAPRPVPHQRRTHRRSVSPSDGEGFTL